MMMRTLKRLAVGALFATASTQAIAQSADWVVSEARGPVTITTAQGRSPASRGTVVTPGDTVITGAGGRAVLVHDKDFVTVAANSRIRIPAEARRATGMTRFFQEIGNAIFNVEKRGTPRFSVDTPYLAAVVKGTVFSVTVGADRTSLQVTEGVVEVATNDGGARQLIRPGSIAMIAASDRYRLTISGDQAGVVDSPARASQPGVAPIVGTGTTGEAPASPSGEAPGETVGVRIEEAIASKPVDLAMATNGMVTGKSPVIATAAVGLTKAVVHRGVQVAQPGGAGKPEGKPDTGKVEETPGTGKSADKPDTGKPADQPDTGKPADQPDAGKPADPPDAGKPADKPDTGKPDNGKPG